MESDKPSSNLSFGPEELRAYTRSAKSGLRKRLRALRRALPEARAASRSQRICERLMCHSAISGTGAVALFWPIVELREVDLRPLHAWLRTQQRRVCYPFMERGADGASQTGFRYVNDPSELVIRDRKFAEPLASMPLAERGEVDVVVVPALAVTLAGDRLGYGSGFYDATLPDLSPPAQSIVVAFDFQCLIELPTEPHDRRCDFVVTDA